MVAPLLRDANSPRWGLWIFKAVPQTRIIKRGLAELQVLTLYFRLATIHSYAVGAYFVQAQKNVSFMSALLQKVPPFRLSGITKYCSMLVRSDKPLD